jgi:hypothetical protein
MTATLERCEWSAAWPGRTLPPGKTRYPFYRRLGGSQGRCGRAENISTGIRSRTFKPVARSLYRLSYPAHRTVYILKEILFNLAVHILWSYKAIKNITNRHGTVFIPLSKYYLEAIVLKLFYSQTALVLVGFIGNWNCRASHCVEIKDRTNFCEKMCMERRHWECYVAFKNPTSRPPIFKACKSSTKMTFY